MPKKNSLSIGGQAVLEGVMMRGAGAMATAVRDPEGKIQIESSRFTPVSKKPYIYRIPIIRGMISFATSMVTGIKTILRATEVYGDLSDEQPTKFEKWLADKLKLDIMSVVGFIGLLLGVLLSVFLFIFVPNWITDGVYKLIKPENYINSGVLVTILKNLTSGVIRIAIFIIYLLLISLMKDVKRMFRYHGAEHRTISCYEHGLPLTVENVQKMSTVHDRCGTTFMFLVMVISIIFFSFFGWQELWLRLLIRLGGIPIVAGISYEILKFTAKYDNVFVKIIKAPGLLLQKITTKEPDDSMAEVAIAAFNTVLELEKDENMPTSEFVTAVNLGKARETLNAEFGNDKFSGETDIILMSILGIDKKSGLSDARINSAHIKEAKEIIKERLTGKPLQYILGKTCFYGYDFKTDERALIPRFDTEILAEQTVKRAKDLQNPEILELCTGSGAVAVTVSKMLNINVTATDISEAALSLAEENSKLLGADVSFIKSDLFESVTGKYDIIAANPPYIPSADINGLETEVKDYEPLIALDGGADGLDFYRKIASEYKNYLKDGGCIILEVGVGQSQDVIGLFGGAQAEIIKDYNNIDRVLAIKL